MMTHKAGLSGQYRHLPRRGRDYVGVTALVVSVDLCACLIRRQPGYSGALAREVTAAMAAFNEYLDERGIKMNPESYQPLMNDFANRRWGRPGLVYRLARSLSFWRNK